MKGQEDAKRPVERIVMQWIPIEEFETDSYEGWCWIYHKGRVTEAYRDHNYIFRFSKYSDGGYQTECISHVMKWDMPNAPTA